MCIRDRRNTGKFIIVESKAPKGYFGDWTDINHPGMANTPLGKRGYYIEITEDSDNSVIWLDNADYNADIAATDKGGTKLVTSTGVETTVTIYDTGKDSSRTFNTDNSGKAANEDSYTITPLSLIHISAQTATPEPTPEPTQAPTPAPTAEPTAVPTAEPTQAPVEETVAATPAQVSMS